MRIRARRARVCTVALIGAIALVVPGQIPASAEPKATPANPASATADRLSVYVGEVTSEQLAEFRKLGLDHEDVNSSRVVNGKVAVEAVLSGREAAKLASRGLKLTEKVVNTKRSLAAAEGVFRTYSAPGGIRDELSAAAAAHPGIAKLETIGTTIQGKPIRALKVTKNARYTPDGTRPAVLYMGGQHAREWITPEMTRRLMHRFLDGYGTDAELTQLVNTRELWFVPVANPDGYDFTFTDGNRLWRKNLRDNDGDGTIVPGDGVDPNRNYAYKWGYDEEGSSADPANETFRGRGPNSEPETKAIDALGKRIRFEYMINYHSAAELLLYGVGWQVSTPSPDDVINIALAGDDTVSAIPGYDPDLSAELYTTNGDTDSHLGAKYGTLGFTPEMSTCTTVSNLFPDDEWLAEDCQSDFNFPDDEALIQAEFLKNIPFALSLAKSAATPDSPISALGRTTPDFVVDAFDTSYGKEQLVATDARKSLRAKTVHWKVNGGRTKTAGVKEWKGGERYGDDGTDYYAEYRGKVTGTKAGDSVEVWFSGISVRPGHRGLVTSEHFTYRVAGDIGGKVLILATEDVTGLSPAQTGTSAKYAATIAASVNAAGYSTDIYDFDTSGRKAPHPLGVLSHYKAIVWETGDDIILRNQGQVGGTTAKAALDTELAVRDYLNEGGKLLATGQYSQYAPSANGAYFYNPYAPPECTTPNAAPCLAVFNDFQQYYLGAYVYVDDAGTLDDGSIYPVGGKTGAFTGFNGTLNGAGSAGNQGHSASFLTTSSFLAPSQFPQFPSVAGTGWTRPGGSPFDPHTGAYYVYSGQSDAAYKRLSKTVDLTASATGELRFWSSYDVEEDWDFLVVEAHEVGTDNWTTLPDVGGNTVTEAGQSCASGWSDLHPFITHYQTPDCTPTGTTGTWNALTGSSGGWTELAYDLSAYAGKKVEVSISYVSDWSTQGLGVFIDDATITAGGTTSFEADLGGWTVAGPPAGSGPTATDFKRTQTAFTEASTVVTPDTVYTGFGIEGFSPAERNSFVKRSLKHLLGY
ncbi:hypothetical protein F4553_005500 [Allocatelliglobosispora scoriae]|uniref:Zinc carboxypeptidase n=1 Tax=Allocatelliglobosispora scoriae TaxID=643052 RepID=A0A841BX24_9ACTN|nr:M14 family metallopeptidase [Allocatelliglobosispora scoriae]MBB5872066.1 hypothetical protein [Allocatelliglobosispora scoriae]